MAIPHNLCLTYHSSRARFVSWFLKHCSRLRCQSFSCSLAQRCKTKGNAVIMSNGCNRPPAGAELQSNAIMQIPLNSTLHLVWVLLLTSKWIRWWEKNIVLANLKLSSFWHYSAAVKSIQAAMSYSYSPQFFLPKTQSWRWVNKVLHSYSISRAE